MPQGGYFDVIVIGGGITGVGVMRDCTLRGLKVLLIEKGDIADGASGRNHGLLHSGARYAVTDIHSARECIRENLILRKVARHCIEPTGGLFISLPEDDPAYQKTFIQACRKADISVEELSAKEALALEPAANPSLVGAVKVPDGSVDPFRLCASNLMDSVSIGAKVLLYTEVTSIVEENGRAVGVTTRTVPGGEEATYMAPVIVNAAGIWGQKVASMAGVKVSMFPAKGSLLVFGHRVATMAINRCRPPANADILVPGDTVSILGTTSDRVDFSECDNPVVTPSEVDLLLREGSALCPMLSSTRVLRAYAGVRPLVASDDDSSGRSISRGMVLLDHAKRDGLEGFVTISGGKLMTYRLMAEKTSDLVCEKLDVKAKCQTAQLPLPGSEGGDVKEVSKKIWPVASLVQKAAAARLGMRARNIPMENPFDRATVCECEEVSVGEVVSAASSQHVRNLMDLRRRTRVGMGTCQGALCACRAASLLGLASNNPQQEISGLCEFLCERWKGGRPIAWGETLREAQYTQWVYREVLGLEMDTKAEEARLEDEV